jgi:hypothetical protein
LGTEHWPDIRHSFILKEALALLNAATLLNLIVGRSGAEAIYEPVTAQQLKSTSQLGKLGYSRQIRQIRDVIVACH